MGTTLIYEDADSTTYERDTPLGIVRETISKTPPDPSGNAFLAEQQAKQAAEFESFKARSGEPSYKAAAVKIAAEKLALTPLIDAALDALINADGDKALLVWWIETDAISRGDAQWQRIEAAVEWPKDVTAADLFDLAAMI